VQDGARSLGAGGAARFTCRAMGLVVAGEVSVKQICAQQCALTGAGLVYVDSDLLLSMLLNHPLCIVCGMDGHLNKIVAGKWWWLCSLQKGCGVDR